MPVVCVIGLVPLYLVDGSSYESTETPYNPVGGSKMHMAYLFWSLVPVTGVPGPNQKKFCIWESQRNLLISHITL